MLCQREERRHVRTEIIGKALLTAGEVQQLIAICDESGHVAATFASRFRELLGFIQGAQAVADK